jgi:exodeoxyribonuclease VII large subunit
LPVFLNSYFLKEKHQLQTIESQLSFVVQKKLDFEKYKNNLLLNKTENSIQRFLNKQNRDIELKKQQLKLAIQVQFNNNNNRLNHFENIARLSDPEVILKKGFSITLMNSKPVSDASHLQEGDIITTRFYKGEKQSQIINKK